MIMTMIHNGQTIYQNDGNYESRVNIKTFKRSKIRWKFKEP